MSSNRWPKVTPDHPCPRCEKPDRCTIAPDGNAGHCFRHGLTWRNRDGGNGRYDQAARARPQTHASDRCGYDWQAEADRLRGAMTDDRLRALAEATNVAGLACELLSPGWASAEDLRRLHASGQDWKEIPPDGAWVFAEHSGDGRIVGLSLRAVDGRKGAPSGSKRGLIVPTDLHQRPDPVLIVEGASDVGACCALGLAAVGRPSNRAGAEDLAIMLDGRAVLVVGERDGKPGGAWPGRDGAKAIAQQLAGRWGEQVRWTLPPLNAKDIREWLCATLAGGMKANDADALRAAGAELLAALEVSAKVAKPERRTQADALVDLARENYRLGVTSDGEAFAVARCGPNIAVMFRGGGSALRSALAKNYRKMTGKTPNASALADALVVLEGMAQDVAPEAVALRLAELDGGVVLDLGDASGRVVVLKPGGWAVEAVSPVLFRRTVLTAALPEPVEAEPTELLKLRELLNVDDATWPLVVGWLVAALLPNIPHPVLMLGGEQGTGKTTAGRLVVRVVDPSPAPLRSEPRDVEQWSIAAAGSWIVCIDNISHISGWLSDAICKAVTGDGLVKRKLYTDSDLAVLAFRRCIVMTSIDPGALRGDLGDRLLLVDLERIPDEQRRTEAELNAAYDAIRPRLLGALLSALSRALAALPDVRLEKMPRMADFARLLAALDVACPELTDGRALALFAGQRQRIAGEVVESDPVAAAVVRLLEGRTEWTGTASELLTLLTPRDDDGRPRPPKGWPTHGRGLVGRLRRVRPALSAVGIHHHPPPTNDKTRTHRIEKVPPEPPEPPSGGDSETAGRVGAEQGVGDSSDVTARPPGNRPRESNDGDGAQAAVDDSGDMGGRSPANSGSCSYGLPDAGVVGNGCWKDSGCLASVEDANDEGDRLEREAMQDEGM